MTVKHWTRDAVWSPSLEETGMEKALGNVV